MPVIRNPGDGHSCQDECVLYGNRKVTRNLAPSLYADRSFGHAAQRTSPEQQLSFLDFPFTHFVPVEVRDNGVVKINNYYVSGDDNRLLSRLIQEIVNDYRGDYTIQSVTHTRHIPVFLSEKFQTVKEWKLYVKMQYGEKPCGESANG